MRQAGLTFAAALLIASTIASEPATADCGRDLTRIQVAAAAASPDIRAAVAGLVSTAQARAKAMDGSGCTAATAEAMKLLGLVAMPPLVLSTPVPGVGRNPHPPAPAATSLEPPAQTPKPQPPQAKAKAASPAPAAPVTAGSRALSPPGAAPTDASDRKDWYVVTSNLLGQHVTAQDRPGDSVGVVKALAIDGTNRQVVLALIETGGFLGIGTDLIAVPFSALTFTGPWDRPMVRANTEVLQAGPRVATSDVTSLLLDPAWRKQVGEHFGIPVAASTASTAKAMRPDVSSAASAKAQPAAAITASPMPAGDPADGHSYVQNTCAACHTFDANGGTRVGPGLYGVFDRKIASVPGFSYSPSLKYHGGMWDAANLDSFLQNPNHFAPRTIMPFAGIPSSEERANVIAYLKSLAAPNGARK